MTKILIIDDEKNIRDLIGEFVQDQFRIEQIDYAEDAFSAYHKMCMTKYDVICLDHYMPYFKGGDFFNLLRTKPGINRDTPVIIVSAFIPELPKNIQASETLFYLEKPMDMDRLCRYLRMILSKEKRMAV